MTGQHPKLVQTGTVGVTGMDTGRFSEFSLALGRLELPPGWEIMGALNYDENHGRNFLVENFTGDWLWFIDDDHGFHPQTLQRLLDRSFRSRGNAVVAPLVTQRRSPFVPVAIKDGKHLHLNGQEPEMIEVDLTGTAGMLIHRSVFDKVEQPYFLSEDLADGTHVPSDTRFCRMLKKARVAIYVDMTIVMGHYNVVGVVPRYKDGRWTTQFLVGNEPVFELARL